MTTRLSVAVAFALGMAMCSPKTAVAPPPATPLRAAEAKAPAPAAELQGLQTKDTRPPCRVEGCCPGRGDTAYVQSDFLVICADGLPSDLCDCHGADGIEENQSKPVNASGR